MRDASTNSPHPAGRALLRAGGVALLLAVAGALGGCASGGAPGASFAMASDGPTVAFESVDGPPPAVFDRLVSVLDSESALRLSGQEVGGKPGRDPWNAADDLVLRKIAQAGFSGLTGMINGGPPAP